MVEEVEEPEPVKQLEEVDPRKLALKRFKEKRRKDNRKISNLREWRENSVEE